MKVRKRLSKKWIIIGLFLFQRTLLGHALFQDSLIIVFQPIAKADTLEACVDEVVDQRDESPCVIGEYEVKRHTFIPVDLILQTEKSLSDEIQKIAGASSEHGMIRQKLKLIINEFELNRVTNSLIYPRYMLNASFQIYQKTDQNGFKYRGQLLYESTSRKPLFRDKLEKGYQNVVWKWERQFADDISAFGTGKSNPILTKNNFRMGEPPTKRLNFIVGTDVALNQSVKTVDAQIYFSNREARKWFYRSGGYHVRYRDEKNFESIEFGLSNDYLFYRIHPQWMINAKSVIQFGINRWKNIQTVPRKLYDAFILEYAVSQTIQWNPLDKCSILIGAGVQESVNYIYSMDARFQAAILFHLGFKL
jgi:hypothetical protein